MQDDTRYRWTSEDLAGKDIPDSAKDFLGSIGLPCSVRGTDMEFGPHDSTDFFVIGKDYDQLIYLIPNGEVRHSNFDRRAGDHFMEDCFFIKSGRAFPNQGVKVNIFHFEGEQNADD